MGLSLQQAAAIAEVIGYGLSLISEANTLLKKEDAGVEELDALRMLADGKARDALDRLAARLENTG